MTVPSSALSPFPRTWKLNPREAAMLACFAPELTVPHAVLEAAIAPYRVGAIGRPLKAIEPPSILWPDDTRNEPSGCLPIRGLARYARPRAQAVSTTIPRATVRRRMAPSPSRYLPPLSP